MSSQRTVPETEPVPALPASAVPGDGLHEVAVGRGAAMGDGVGRDVVGSDGLGRAGEPEADGARWMAESDPHMANTDRRAADTDRRLAATHRRRPDADHDAPDTDHHAPGTERHARGTDDGGVIAELEADALARLYDLDLRADPGDVDLYLALAARTGGPILELAVGTGRIAVPLAEAGHQVVGVDTDRAMLARARARAERAGGDAARRVRLVEADCVGLTLPDAGRYQLAFIALNSITLLGDSAGQREAFRTMARHLAPGGLAVVDVWLPDGDDLARFDGRLSLESQLRDPETGRIVVKLASAVHDPITGTVELTQIWEEGLPGERPGRWMRTDRLRLVDADDLRSLAVETGFAVEAIAGGYDLEPLVGGAERAVLIAVRSPA